MTSRQDGVGELTSIVLKARLTDDGSLHPQPLLSLTEMKRISVFKNYDPGEPTCRLYVKNIAKQVEEKVGALQAAQL